MDKTDVAALAGMGFYEVRMGKEVAEKLSAEHINVLSVFCQNSQHHAEASSFH